MASVEERMEEVLQELRVLNRKIHRKKKVVNEFLEALKQRLETTSCQALQGCHFQHVGSCYEHTVVSNAFSYDIILILPQPYRGFNFEVIERYNATCYKLHWRHGDNNFPKFVNRKGFLDVHALRECIFNGLSKEMNELMLEYPRWCLTSKPQMVGFGVTLTDRSGDLVKIRMVPQLCATSWKDVPRLLPKEKLPAPLRDYVTKIEIPLFTLFTPKTYSQMNDHHLLTSTSFSVLEKRCMSESDVVREAVMLMKLTSEILGWRKNFGLRAFQIKRVAIKYFDRLDDLDTWTCFQRMLKFLSNELRTGLIDGFFIHNQDIFCKRRNICNALATKIYETKIDETPHKFWDHLIKSKCSSKQGS